MFRRSNNGDFFFSCKEKQMLGRTHILFHEYGNCYNFRWGKVRLTHSLSIG